MQFPDYKTISVESLIPYARNSRTHSAEQIAQIAASIKEFGFLNPIIVDGDNGIVAGHGRLLAAQKLGLKELPIIEASHLSEAQRRAYIIADNKLALNAGWDGDMLRIEIAELQQVDFNIDLLGFGDDELDGLLNIEQPQDVALTAPDEVPEAPENPVTKQGDIWVLGKHRLMCGDGTSIDAIDSLMDGESASMVFTDPPYGIGLDKDGQTLGKSRVYGAVLNDHDTTVAIDAFKLTHSICRCPLFFWGANYYSQILPGSPCWIVWDKQGGKHVTYADVELCYSNIDAPARLFTHIWDGFRRDSEQGEKRIHPTQKPVQLIMDIWEFFGKHISGILVLDLFGGSGSTLIACERTGRKARLMELDSKYCDMIVNRWQDYTGRQAVLESTGQTFDELKNVAESA